MLLINQLSAANKILSGRFWINKCRLWPLELFIHNLCIICVSRPMGNGLIMIIVFIFAFLTCGPNIFYRYVGAIFVHFGNRFLWKATSFGFMALWSIHVTFDVAGCRTKFIIVWSILRRHHCSLLILKRLYRLIGYHSLIPAISWYLSVGPGRCSFQIWLCSSFPSLRTGKIPFWSTTTHLLRSLSENPGISGWHSIWWSLLDAPVIKLCVVNQWNAI